MGHLLHDRNLTTWFALYEFLVSRDFPELAGMLNPAGINVNNLHLLCATILEPTRAEFGGVPIIPTSGYRDVLLNIAVKGHKFSLHKYGKAADWHPKNRALLEPMFRYIRDSLPFAWVQLIWYRERRFIHVAIPHPGTPRLCEVR